MKNNPSKCEPPISKSGESQWILDSDKGGRDYFSKDGIKDMRSALSLIT